ncbi:ABC-F family ATP-binding cassette domain-containing protein [Inhella sp.]|uniref:ABC-F family ATP-binding cassette domain-containing protein n=1 Tax=Inhella sp. TaxID=1921806 RepID=UPI0035AEA0A2
MITLKSVTLLRGAKRVLDGASAVLQPGERIGLIGANGAGKSSLFALLAGRLQLDAGDFFVPPQWRMSEVAQQLPETEQAATDFVLDGDQTLLKAKSALALAEAAMDGLRIAEAHAALQDAGAFDARSRAQALLLGLGFQLEQLDAPVNTFSGGWRMRLQLARTLINPSELMLLDEPTNHLDLDALVWLEGWLTRYEGLLLIISHDREFLDATTRVTLHLENGQLTRYGGSYSSFELQRAERLAQQQQAFDKQQERIAHLQRFIDRFKAKATKARQAQSRVKQLERMERIGPVLSSADFAFEFREPESLPNPMLSLQGLDCGYAPGAPIVRGVERSVMAGQRIGILGANGQGKSTLVKTIAGLLPPLGGEMVAGKGLAIGYFAQQEMDLLRADEHALAHMTRLAREVSPQSREQELRDFLGQFSFGGDLALQAVGSLSGGERARLVLALIAWQRPNLLLLDEPTNHLDLMTREALSMALGGFDGTVLLVSHDRALLRDVCDRFWLVADGGLREFDGDLDDYQRWLNDRERERARPAQVKDAPVAPAARQQDRRAAAALRQQAAPLKKEMDAIDRQLGAWGAERAALEAELSAGGAGGERIAQVGRRLKELADSVEEAELRWLELGEQVEGILQS